MKNKSQAYIPLDDSWNGEGLADVAYRSVSLRKSFSKSLLLWITTALAVLLMLSNILWISYWMNSGALKTGKYYEPEPHEDIELRIETLPVGFLDDNMTVSDMHWFKLFPDGDGVVALSESWVASHSLPPSLRAPDDQTQSVYIMAGFHQLHCLSHIRRVLASYYFDPTFAITQEAVWGHTRHCVDALRQWILCHPDDTLLVKRDGQLPGEGQLRRCKNFGAYKQWAEAHSYVFPE